jgi:hypothetical protein
MKIPFIGAGPPGLPATAPLPAVCGIPAVVAHGLKHGIPFPVNRCICGLIRFEEQLAAGSKRL